jgi:hypothetical protein
LIDVVKKLVVQSNDDVRPAAFDRHGVPLAGRLRGAGARRHVAVERTARGFRGLLAHVVDELDLVAGERRPRATPARELSMANADAAVGAFGQAEFERQAKVAHLALVAEEAEALAATLNQTVFDDPHRLPVLPLDGAFGCPTGEVAAIEELVAVVLWGRE